MYRYLAFFLVVGIFISCSKNEGLAVTPDVIPAEIDGEITEFNLTPIDINTPDKGTFFISVINTSYKVDFSATTQSASNAVMTFNSDTILIDQSQEFANFGKDAIAYNPVAPNLIKIFFHDGRRVIGSFSFNTTFGGVFGEALISQWRQPGDPTKPAQKAKDDLIKLVHRFSDNDGPGAGTAPQYLFVTVSKK